MTTLYRAGVLLAALLVAAAPTVTASSVVVTLTLSMSSPSNGSMSFYGMIPGDPANLVRFQADADKDGVVSGAEAAAFAGKIQSEINSRLPSASIGGAGYSFGSLNVHASGVDGMVFSGNAITVRGSASFSVSGLGAADSYDVSGSYPSKDGGVSLDATLQISAPNGWKFVDASNFKTATPCMLLAKQDASGGWGFKLVKVQGHCSDPPADEPPKDEESKEETGSEEGETQKEEGSEEEGEKNQDTPKEVVHTSTPSPQSFIVPAQATLLIPSLAACHGISPLHKGLECAAAKINHHLEGCAAGGQDLLHILSCRAAVSVVVGLLQEANS